MNQASLRIISLTMQIMTSIRCVRVKLLFEIMALLKSMLFPSEIKSLVMRSYLFIQHSVTGVCVQHKKTFSKFQV